MLDVFTGFAFELLRPLDTERGAAISAFSMVGLSLVIVASFVRTMVPLRGLTLLSNLFLLASACIAPNPASILLYCVLIPLNAYRLVEIQRLTRRVLAASDGGDLSGIWLKPYMRAHHLPAGDVLFKKGDRANSLYLLAQGELQLVEINRLQPVGQLFGEIAFFSPSRARTLTAVCVTDCVVLEIGEEAFKRIYFQNPKFAFQVSNLIAHRLSADVERMRLEIDTSRHRDQEES